MLSVASSSTSVVVFASFGQQPNMILAYLLSVQILQKYIVVVLTFCFHRTPYTRIIVVAIETTIGKYCFPYISLELAE